jgi:chromosomal replication initiation ATPase DnaA
VKIDLSNWSKDVIRQFVTVIDKEISVENIKNLVAKYFDIACRKAAWLKQDLDLWSWPDNYLCILQKHYTNSSLKSDW